MARQRKPPRGLRPVARRKVALPEVPEVAPAPVPAEAAAPTPVQHRPVVASDQLDDWLRRMIEAAYT